MIDVEAARLEDVEGVSSAGQYDFAHQSVECRDERTEEQDSKCA